MGNNISLAQDKLIIRVTSQLSDSKDYYQTLLKQKVQILIEASVVTTNCCFKTEQELIYEQNKLDMQLSKKGYLTNYPNNQFLYKIQVNGKELVGCWYQLQFVQYWGNMFYSKSKAEKEQFRNTMDHNKQNNQQHQNWHSKIQLFTPQFNLSLVFISQAQHKKIFFLFQTMKRYFTTFYPTEKFNSVAYKHFFISKLSKDKQLQTHQIQGLKARMNIPAHEFKKIQSLKGYQQTKTLAIQQYMQFIHLIQCRSQLLFIFQKYCSKYKKTKGDQNQLIWLQKMMTQAQFDNFLKNQQTENLSQNEELLKRIAYLNLKNKQIKYQQKYQQKLYSFSQFCMYLLSLKLNSGIICQNLDSSKPLPSYFVNSSHNTYLTGNQLTSYSSANVYYQNLKDGIRCLELDIHNGKSGPIIKHGYTFTQQVLFQNVIKSIKKFNHENPYHTPIVLSFQNHCDFENCSKMANILRQNFSQDNFYKIPRKGNNTQVYPQLKDLEGKIIIQGTGSFSDFYTNIIKENKSIQLNKNQQLVLNILKKINDPKLRNQLFSPNLNQKAKQRIQKFVSKIQHLKQKKIYSQSLLQQYNQQMMTKIITANNQLVKFYGLIVSPLDLNNTCWEMANIAQNNLNKSFQGQEQPTPETILTYSHHSMIRIYPFGLRFNSSNYNPIPMLQCGCQLTSLNTQKIDIYYVVMQGIFQRHKNIGYAIKPELKFPSQQSKLKKQQIKIFQITFISCNSLSPRKLQDQQNLTDLKISFLGTKIDMINNRKYVNVSKQAEYLENQKIQISQQFKCRQFYMSFNCKYSFKSQNREFSEFPGVKLSINDQHFANLYLDVAKCGSIGLPLKDLKTGYRTVPLVCFQLGKRRQIGNLLIHIKKQTL